ncbi:unnamed protein product, partial [Mesorhabditis spiculigera]
MCTRFFSSALLTTGCAIVLLSYLIYNRFSIKEMSPKPFENAEGGSVKLNSGYFMPIMGLGTYKLPEGAELGYCLDAALRVGYRLFDTAIKYGNEADIGMALESLLPIHNLKREDIFITSKIFPPKDNFAAEVEKGVGESLIKLKTSYIDLYLVHYPTYDVFSEEADQDPMNAERRKQTYLALQKIAQSGRIRSVGVSNFEEQHLAELEILNVPMPAVNQVEYHPHFIRKELHEACKKRGIVFSAFGSLGRMAPSLFQDEAVDKMATAMGCNKAQLLLAFAISQNIPVCPKSTKEERMRENFESYKFQLTDDKVKALEARDKPGTEGNYIRAYGWRVR